jgi:hypothetical protein
MDEDSESLGALLMEIVEKTVQGTNPGELDAIMGTLEDESARMPSIGRQKSDVITAAVQSAYYRYTARMDKSLSFNILDMGAHHGDMSLLILKAMLHLKPGQVKVRLVAVERRLYELQAGRRLLEHAFGGRSDLQYHVMRYVPGDHGPYGEWIQEVAAEVGVGAFDYISFDQEKSDVRSNLYSLLRNKQLIPGGTVLFCDNVLDDRVGLLAFLGFGELFQVQVSAIMQPYEDEVVVSVYVGTTDGHGAVISPLAFWRADVLHDGDEGGLQGLQAVEAAGGGGKFDCHELDAIRAYYRRYGVACIKNALEATTMHQLRQRTARLTPSADNHRTWAANVRLTECLPSSSTVTSPVYQDPRLQRVFQHVHGYPLVRNDFPAEYRIYPSGSPGMIWHDDIELTEPHQVEIVITLENNNSNTRVVWEPADELAEETGQYDDMSYGDDDDPVHERMSVSPKAGEVLMVEARKAYHKVTPLVGGGGARAIIKLVAHAEGAEKTASYRREKRLCEERQTRTSFRCVCGEECDCNPPREP